MVTHTPSYSKGSVEKAPGKAIEHANKPEENKGGKLRYILAAGAFGIMAIGAATYVSINKHDDDSGHSDVGTYNTVAPVIMDDSTSPAYDQAADQIIEEIAEEEGISLEADTPSETEEPATPEYLTDPLSGRQEPYNPELDRNGDGIQDVWYNDAGKVGMIDKNFDGKLNYIGGAIIDVEPGTDLRRSLEGTGIGELADIYPGLYRIDMEQWDDDFDGTMDRVVMTYYYSGGEDRKEFKWTPVTHSNWVAYAQEQIDGRWSKIVGENINL